MVAAAGANQVHPCQGLERRLRKVHRDPKNLTVFQQGHRTEQVSSNCSPLFRPTVTPPIAVDPLPHIACAGESSAITFALFSSWRGSRWLGYWCPKSSYGGVAGEPSPRGVGAPPLGAAYVGTMASFHRIDSQRARSNCCLPTPLRLVKSAPSSTIYAALVHLLVVAVRP